MLKKAAKWRLDVAKFNAMELRLALTANQHAYSLSSDGEIVHASRSLDDIDSFLQGMFFALGWPAEGEEEYLNKPPVGIA
ncbi:hypothetical protein [Hyphomicrobium sp. 2TAF46]|uniref:hypothetical protein n=1 Tax=Hyphomicrobium sp. 2TAF46 TaxID=3233019 RepID=UPI003F8E2955